MAAPESDAAHAVQEQPVLWLGMSGFAPPQRAALESSLARPAGLPRWRLSALEDADAWWVNGAKVRLKPDGNLKVSAGLPTEHVLHLNMGEVDRPVAFASPLECHGLEPLCAFDPASRPSIHAVLLQFDNWLRGVRSEFVLGGQVIRQASQARQGIYHISHGGTLLAIMDFTEGKVALSPVADPVDLAQAQWDKRPISAGDMPHNFKRFTAAQLAWTYACRTDRDMLPSRYRARPIYFCQVPAVPLRWLRDSQLLLLRELSVEAGTFQELHQRTSLPVGQIGHDLACLYYSGAITTTRKRAAQPQRTGRDRPQSSAPESVAADQWRAHHEHDLTAPALLERKRFPPPGGSSSG